MFAGWANIYDRPSDRNIHKRPVPLLGGISIFFAFNITVILGHYFNLSLVGDPFLSRWAALLVCQTIILALGSVDDAVHLQPSVKLLFQIIVAVLMILFGFGIGAITNPFTGDIVRLGIFSAPFTILWLVGITNALNLIDGLDGLSAGTSFIVSLTIGLIAYINGNAGIVFVTLCLAGSLLGFLPYNFHPAKIFLGDSGSLLLGFILAVISIQGSSKGPALVGLLAPILALGFPIMETLLSMIRRFLRSIRIIDDPTRNGRFRTVPVSKPSIFRADKDHFHHRLLKFGYSQKKAVILLYAICIALSVLAFLVVAIEDLNLTAALAAIIIVFFIGIKRLKYDEFRILENGLLIPLFSYPIINKSLFQVFIDLGMISFSFYLSFLLLFRGFDGPVRELFVRSLSIVLLVKIVVFHFSGLYKRSWVYSRLEDALAVLKATFLSSLISVVVLAFIFKLESFGGIVLFVLDFYLLLTGVAGLRISHHVFISYYRRSAAQRGKKVLIYGAGGRGSTVLREIRKNGNYSFSPAGFMDDSPEKKGIQMQGVPVLGSIEDLDEIFRENNISEIIVSTTKIGRDKIKRLTEFGKQKGIVIRQYEYRFYEFS
ncbi:MAG: hypothetical protein A2V45_13065 [Candidatus Aminicenantes bacterium RBG_19FT_COMBO_58_17]|nr:MAG: hypothetical protein A2V45_13065 [Candidatus Aminicenantes bacterium RBG_19FT_COMBO_58_17]